ncbi:hypothetical protein KFL_003480070 [Klebsormidium nitens]|uniref:CST complex subunit TEN1 n=1 Tax=Klebsormidium nitens TaxID=105231 RepID=A0A1Y1I9X3_KLENI|nr:hypothetical protein KFL_003480070 [Klebsormidium nitens]|eukprot:GAQ87363.1 hypothetical protein KFL_003480070 [Klebsormidium nitens]
MASVLRSGQIITLDEVVNVATGSTIRLMGRLHNIDFASNAAELANGGQQLLLDLSTISHEVLKEGSLYQVIGELHRADHRTESNAQAVFLAARVVRNVDGLDQALYDQALKLRRTFMESMPVG